MSFSLTGGKNKYIFKGVHQISNTLIYLKLNLSGTATHDKFIACFEVENEF